MKITKNSHFLQCWRIIGALHYDIKPILLIIYPILLGVKLSRSQYSASCTFVKNTVAIPIFVFLNIKYVY